MTTAIRSPWRRFFARYLDSFIYSTVWGIILLLVFNVSISLRGNGGKLLDSIIGLAMILFIEPAQLSLFGTTAGKAVFGLRVTNPDGSRLSYGDALARTWTVLWRGMGLAIPIYSLVRLWKSYKACRDGETLEWDYDSSMTLKDTKAWRIVACIAAFLALTGILILAFFASELPSHRGELTVAQFCDNYNEMSELYNINTESRLKPDGTWADSGSTEIGFFAGSSEPEFKFTEENGLMTGMEFTLTADGDDIWAPSCRNEMILAVLAFAGAQKQRGLFSGETGSVIQSIAAEPYEDFSFRLYDVDAVCHIEFTGADGITDFGSFVRDNDSGEISYSVSFSMSKG